MKQQQYILIKPQAMLDTPSRLSRPNSSAIRQKPINNNLLINSLKQVADLKIRPFKVVNQLVLLLKQQPFFLEFANNFKLLNDIAQKIEFAHFEQGDSIYHIRELSNYFYIILQGTAHLTIPEEIQPAEEETKSSEYLDGQQIFTVFSQSKSTLLPTIQAAKSSYIDKIIKIVEKGGSFGDMMGDKSIRATNAIAVDDCKFLAVNKKTYDLLSKAQLKTDNRSKFTFLASLPIFQHLHTFSLQSICLLINEVEMTYGQVLFHEGEEIKNIFIVHSGEFKLMKAVAKHAATSLQRKTKGKSEYQSILLPKKEVPFIIVQAGEILGDGEIVTFQQKYQDMCMCQSQTTRVYAIDKRLYFKNLTAQKEDYSIISTMIEEKYARRKSKIYEFLKRRSRQSQMNTLLNSNEWAIRPKEFKVSDKSGLNSSVSSITSQEIINNQSFFINELNKTIAQNPHLNRFSINKKKCKTEANSQNKVGPLIKNKKKEGVPHCVQDIVTLVKLKSNFLRRFRKQRKRERNVFKFDMSEVPLFIKSKYNKIQLSK